MFILRCKFSYSLHTSCCNNYATPGNLLCECDNYIPEAHKPQHGILTLSNSVGDMMPTYKFSQRFNKAKGQIKGNFKSGFPPKSRRNLICPLGLISYSEHFKFSEYGPLFQYSLWSDNSNGGFPVSSSLFLFLLIILDL